jgi:hypothetical protein
LKLALNAIKAAFVFFCLSQFANSQQLTNRIFDDDVQIISSDQSGILLNYSAPPATLVSIEGYPEQFKYPQIARTAQNRKPGQPLLPVKIVPVAVPSGARPTISILSQDYTVLAKVAVSPFITASSVDSFNAQVSAKANYPKIGLSKRLLLPVRKSFVALEW